jgi:hypothetical protein
MTFLAFAAEPSILPGGRYCHGSRVEQDRGADSLPHCVVPQDVAAQEDQGHLSLMPVNEHWVICKPEACKGWVLIPISERLPAPRI